MALKKTSRNYEILIRFNDDGKIGMHQQELTTVTDAGAVLSARVEDAAPLSLADLQKMVAAWTEDDMYVPPVEEVSE